MKLLTCTCSKAYILFIIFCILSLLEKIEKNWFESRLNYQNNFINSTNSTGNNYNYTNDIYNSSILTNSNYTLNTMEFQNVKEISLLYFILENISDLFAGLLLIFSCIKKYLKRHVISQNSFDYSLYDLSKREKRIILIILISILHFLANTSELFFFIIFEAIKLNILQTNYLISIDVFARIIFCHVILKTKL